MNKNKNTLQKVTHKAKRVSAVGALSLTAAAAPALSPDSAQAKMTHKRTESIATLAKMIEVHEQTPEPHASVELFSDLPNGQQAEMTMRSTSTSIKDVEYVDISVYEPEGNNYVKPVINFAFSKFPDGTWGVTKQVASPKRPNVLHNTIVTNSAVSTYTQVGEYDTIVETHPTEVENRAYAHETLINLQDQAGRVLGKVIQGEVVPQSELH